MSAKIQALDLIRNLPEDATYEDIIEELCFRAKVEEGLSDEREGRVVSHEQFEQQSCQWLPQQSGQRAPRQGRASPQVE